MTIMLISSALANRSWKQCPCNLSTYDVEIVAGTSSVDAWMFGIIINCISLSQPSIVDTALQSEWIGF